LFTTAITITETRMSISDFGLETDKAIVPEQKQKKKRFAQASAMLTSS